MATAAGSSAPTADDTPAVFAERLWVPWWWWPAAVVVVGLLGAEIHIGLGWRVAVVTYLVLGAATIALLLRWGGMRLAVTADAVLLARRRLPLARVVEVRVFDRRDTRAVLAHRQGSAVLHVRGYAKGLVYVATDGRDDSAPYWLLSTRRPAELAAALPHTR